MRIDWYATYLFGSGHDLDLRLNFQHDLSRSNYISFDAARQEKYDAGKRNIWGVSMTDKTSNRLRLKSNRFRLCWLSRSSAPLVAHLRLFPLWKNGFTFITPLTNLYAGIYAFHAPLSIKLLILHFPRFLPLRIHYSVSHIGYIVRKLRVANL